MAISPNGKHLYPMLEGATAEDKAAGLGSDLRIFEESGHSIGGDEPQKLLDVVTGFLVYNTRSKHR